MFGPISRRDFLTRSAAATALAALATRTSFAATKPEELFQISLAQWSLHRSFNKSAKVPLDPLNFARIAHVDYGIDAVEYVNQFYAGKKNDEAYLKSLKQMADDHGVDSVLIMCDGEGNLGDPDEKKRLKAVENHVR